MAENGDAWLCVCVLCVPACLYLCLWGGKLSLVHVMVKRGVGSGSAGWWVAASTAKDESRQFSQLSGG